LPVTLLDLYVNEDKKTFSDIYKHENIQNEYVIWNIDTKNHLLSKIREHFRPHINQLLEFTQQEFEFVKIPGNLPLYTQKFSEIVQYEMLDKEIKIGKYYARMWVKNASSIQMTNDELKEFYSKVEQLVRQNSEYDIINSNTEEVIQNLTL